MARQSLVAPEDQRVTFVELFFDLVFVFALTQVTAQLRDDLSLAGAGRALLVFWLIWWAWTQFTWALNPADTTHRAIEVATLAASAVAFFMAVAVPDAFQGSGLWFAVPYALVRLIGLALYLRVAADDDAQRLAVRAFAVLSTSGLTCALVGGALDDPARTWLWAAALVLDLVAAQEGRRTRAWALRPEHFSERHGLFVIVALGESLVAVGVAVVDAELQADLVVVASLAVAVACLLWWTYFGWLKGALDTELREIEEGARASLARDAYSLLHFPLVFGIVPVAAALEEAVAHPGDPLSRGAAVALGAGALLFVGSPVASLWRANRHVLASRLVILVTTLVALTALHRRGVVVELVVLCFGLVAVAVVEERARPDLDRVATCTVSSSRPR